VPHIEAQQVGEDLDLAAAAGAGADPDRRDAQALGDRRGELLRDELEDEAKAPASWTAWASASSARAWPLSLPRTRTLPAALAAWGVQPMWPTTGMPAFTTASIVRALRTPPSSLTAWAPASERKRPAFETAWSTVV